MFRIHPAPCIDFTSDLGSNARTCKNERDFSPKRTCGTPACHGPFSRQGMKVCSEKRKKLTAGLSPRNGLIARPWRKMTPLLAGGCGALKVTLLSTEPEREWAVGEEWPLFTSSRSVGWGLGGSPTKVNLILKVARSTWGRCPHVGGCKILYASRF